MSINISEFSRIIDSYLHKVGKPVTVVINGCEKSIYAVITRTWHKDKSKFEGINTKLGKVVNDYYEYFGPSDFDITVMTDDDYLCCDGRKYFFVKAEKISAGGYVQYYTGMLKRICEGDSNVFGE